MYNRYLPLYKAFLAARKTMIVHCQLVTAVRVVNVPI
jgi:hypothetical protein